MNAAQSSASLVAAVGECSAALSSIQQVQRSGEDGRAKLGSMNLLQEKLIKVT